MIAVKLELSISTKIVSTIYGDRQEFVFSVLDLDRSESYPQNFVCILPKRLESKSSAVNPKFRKIYGAESNQLAIKLLNAELSNGGSSEVKDEIRRRLKALEPAKPLTAKCNVCGCVFEPRKFRRYIQRTCQNCRSKYRSGS